MLQTVVTFSNSTAAVCRESNPFCLSVVVLS